MDDKTLEKAQELKTKIQDLKRIQNVLVGYKERSTTYDHCTELNIVFFKPQGNDCSKYTAGITRKILPDAFDECIEIMIEELARKIKELDLDYRTL